MSGAVIWSKDHIIFNSVLDYAPDLSLHAELPDFISRFGLALPTGDYGAMFVKLLSVGRTTDVKGAAIPYYDSYPVREASLVGMLFDGEDLSVVHCRGTDTEFTLTVAPAPMASNDYPWRVLHSGSLHHDKALEYAVRNIDVGDTDGVIRKLNTYLPRKMTRALVVTREAFAEIAKTMDLVSLLPDRITLKH